MTNHDQRQRRADELRARLAAADPACRGGPAAVVDESSDVVSTRIEEAVMATRITPSPSRSSSDAGGDPAHGSRSRWLAAAAVIVLVAAAAAAALVGGFLADDARDSRSGGTLALTAPGADATSSCLAFDVGFLREMPLAFAGTATTVTDAEVVLDVDRWYKAGPTQREASIVTLSVPGGKASVALDGVQFTEGEGYLVAATDGQVNGCGFSGPATPELSAAYQEAFTG